MSKVALGLVTPVVTMLPRAHADWELDGTIEDVARIVQAAEAAGYDHVTCSEHVAIPTEVAALRGSRYWDPLATFGYLAACTERIRFATYVVVLGYHHPLALAKRYGTLDVVSGGRLVLGVGIGSLEAEFELLAAPFADRAERADDCLAALRAALSNPEPSFHGRYFDFDGLIVDPCAMQPRVPIWVGGRTRRSLSRAVRLADGWAPFGLTSSEVAGALAWASGTAYWADRVSPLEVVLQPPMPLDPAGEPGAAEDAMGALVEAGATIVDLRLVHSSPASYIEQLEAMAELVTPAGRGRG